MSTVPHTYLEGATAEEHEQGLVSLHPLQEEQGWLPEVIYAGQVTSLGEKGLVSHWSHTWEHCHQHTHSQMWTHTQWGPHSQNPTLWVSTWSQPVSRESHSPRRCGQAMTKHPAYP